MGTIDPSAWIAPSAVVTGGVTLGPGSRVLHGAVLNGDLGPVRICAGRPARLFSPDQHDELWKVQEPLDFPGTVYGVPRGTSMREIMRRQSEAHGPS